MSDEFLIYEVKPEDTLPSIGEKFGMSGNEVQDFHNRHCGKAGLLWISGLTGIRKIVLPSKPAHPKEILEQKQKFLPSKTFSPEIFGAKYQVLERFENQDEELLEMTYNVVLKFSTRKTREDEQIILSIDRQNFKKNGAEPDDKTSSLSLVCMKAVSPIEFMVSQKGKLEKLHEFEKIQEKFKKKKENIRDYHTGEAVENYIAKFEENISDENYLFTKLSSTLLTQILFPGNLIFHQEGKFEKKLQIIPNSFPVKFHFESHYNFENDNVTELNIYGEIIEECSLQELLLGVRSDSDPEDFVKGNLDLNYSFNKKTRQIEQAITEIRLLTDDEIYSRQILKITKHGG